MGDGFRSVGPEHCFNWRSGVFCLVVTGLLLQIVGYNRSSSTSPDYQDFSDTGRRLVVRRKMTRPVTPRPPGTLLTNIIVMSSNPRSGSSFTGELLSAATDSAFFFEPLWYYVETMKDHQPSFEEKKSLLLNLLQCDFHDPRIKQMLYSNKQSTHIFRKPSIAGLRYDEKSVRERATFVKKMEIKCRKTRTRVIKTIRLNMTEIQEILSALPQVGTVNKNNLHVVYLARDPRGIINSIKTQQSQWPAKFLDPGHICSRLYKDSVFQANYSHPQLRVVRYEDLAVTPQKELRGLEVQFNRTFLGSREIFLYLRDHIRSSSSWSSKDYKDGVWSRPRGREQEENPVRDLINVVAKKKQFEKDDLVEDVVVKENGVDRDYYDENGKIATLRRKREANGALFSFFKVLDRIQTRLRRSILPSYLPRNIDPLGRSYYYSTYRKKGFTPDHWRSQLPRELLQKIVNESSCQAVFEAYHYPPE